MKLDVKVRAWVGPYFRLAGDGTVLDYRAGQPDGLDLPPDQVLGRRIEDVLPDEAANSIRRTIAEAAASGHPASTESTLRLPSGGRTFEACVVPCAHDQLILVTRDVPDSERAIPARRDGEEHVRALAEGSPDVIMQFDPQLRLLYANAPVAAMIGIPTGDLIGKTIRELGPPDVLCDAWEAALKGVFSTGKPNRIEFELPPHTWFDWLLVPELANDGGVSTVVTAARDITASKQTEEALERLLAEHTAKLADEIGKHRLTEEQLGQAKAWREGILEGSRDAIFISEPGSRFMEVNAAACELTGYSRAELLAMSIPDLHEAADLHAYEAFHDRILAGEEILSEAKILRKDGRKIDAEFSNRRITVGGVTYMHTSARDVSARVVAETALRESEERFHRLADAAFEGIAITDQGRLVDVNTQLAEILRCSPTDLIGRNALDFVDPVDHGLVSEHFRSGSGDTYEHLMVRADGTRFPAEVQGRIVPRGGKTLRVTAIRDITDRKHADEGRRESENQFRAVSAAAQDAIIMMDSDERITFWSDAAERIFGYNQNEALGRNPHNLLAPPEYREKFRWAFPHWRETGRGDAVGRTIEWAALRKDGTEFPIELSLAATLIKGRWNAVAIIRDITARYKAEEELRRAAEALSGTVKILEEQHRRNIDLGELRGLLQASSSTSEIGPVIVRSMMKLFPGSAGALFLLRPPRTDLESVARWGDFPEHEEDNVFAPGDCWALRRGAVYMVDETGGLLCSHVKHPPAAGYVCLPLTAKGDVLGLLHIRTRAEEEPGKVIRMDRLWKDVSAALSEMLSLAVSNIRLRETLSNQSMRDPLTGLFNRRYLEDDFQREILRAARNQEPIGVVMIDIDHFKLFNDLQGHAAGDRVLVALAGFLQSRMRGADIVCRYGGEEFTLILPECDLENAQRRASQLVVDARQITVQDGERAIGRITLSIGVAAYPEHGTNPAALLAVADAALYQAKQAGRDRVVSA